MDPLTETEKQIIALSLFGFVMRAGPGQFERTVAIADKLGIGHELTKYALDWIVEPKEDSGHPKTLDNSAQATVKFAIFQGIVTQWHHKEELKFAEILKESIYRELFEGIHCGSAIRELIERQIPEQ
jgi:hypothetical protein